MKKKTGPDVFTRAFVAGLRGEPAPPPDPNQEPTTPEDREKLARILKAMSDAWRPAKPETTEPKGIKK